MKGPILSGKMVIYQTWKENLNLLVHPKLNEPTEILKLQEVVPKEEKVELRTRRTLVEVWQYLDLE